MTDQGSVSYQESPQPGQIEIPPFWRLRCRQIQRYVSHCDACEKSWPGGLTAYYLDLARRGSPLDQIEDGEEEWPRNWETKRGSWISFFSSFKKETERWPSGISVSFEESSLKEVPDFGFVESDEPDVFQQQDQPEEVDTSSETQDHPEAETLELERTVTHEYSPELTVSFTHPESLPSLSQVSGVALDGERSVHVKSKTADMAYRPGKPRHDKAEYRDPNSLLKKGQSLRFVASLALTEVGGGAVTISVIGER